MGLAFEPGYNAYDLAKRYAEKYSAQEREALKIQFHCGTTCFNYVNSERNDLDLTRCRGTCQHRCFTDCLVVGMAGVSDLAFFEYLDELGIEYSTVLTWNKGHDSRGICTAISPHPLTCAQSNVLGGPFADEKNGHDIMLFHARNFGQLEFQ